MQAPILLPSQLYGYCCPAMNWQASRLAMKSDGPADCDVLQDWAMSAVRASARHPDVLSVVAFVDEQMGSVMGCIAWI